MHYIAWDRSKHPSLSVGTVIRTSAVKMLEMEVEYVCTACKQPFTMEADFEQFYIIPKPTRYFPRIMR